MFLKTEIFVPLFCRWFNSRNEVSVKQAKPMNINNILIVDDEAEVCILLQNFLLRKNQKVSYSTNLKDGLEMFEKIKPNLLILDHNMPDGLGIEYISNFKNRNKSVKVVIISAMSNLKDEALKNGADYFLEKPISFSMLKNIIK